MSEGAAYARSAGFVLRKLGDGWVFIRRDSEPNELANSVWIDDVGKRILDLIDEHVTEGSMLLRFVSEYNVELELAREDIRRFLQSLVRCGILVSSNQKVGTENESPFMITMGKGGISSLVRAGYPLHGSFEITGKCNFACVHCYVWPERSKPDLTTEEAIEIIDQLAEAGCIWLHLTGGEVFVRRDFMEIYMRAWQRGMIVSITTNGSLIDEEVASSLGKYPPRRVVVSLYGASGLGYQRVTRARGGFDGFLKGIELLRSYGIRTTLSVILLKENSFEVEPLMRFCKSLGLDFQAYYKMIPRIDGSTEPWKHVLDESSVAGMARIGFELGELPVPGAIRPSCQISPSSFHIDCSGMLMQCRVMRTPSFSVLDLSFEEAWKSLSQHRSERIVEGADCGDCEFL